MPRVGNGGPVGVRLNPKQDARCRTAIQTTQLIHRLNDFALQKPCRYTGHVFTMTDTQVRAALGLLRKTIPDLAVTELRGDANNPVAIDFRWAPATPTIEHEAVVADGTNERVEQIELEWENSSEQPSND
jgi:hypothetical protein